MRRAQEEMLARRATTYEIHIVKMKLKSHRIRSMEELVAMEDKSPAVCGPSPSSFAARHGLKLSKPFVAFVRRQRANGNGAHKVAQSRRKPVAA